MNSLLEKVLAAVIVGSAVGVALYGTYSHLRWKYRGYFRGWRSKYPLR
jgi:hypothetical protein